MERLSGSSRARSLLTRKTQLRVGLVVDRTRPDEVGLVIAVERQRLEVEQFAVSVAVDALGADRTTLHGHRVDNLQAGKRGAAVGTLQVALEPPSVLGNRPRRPGGVGVVERDRNLRALGSDP